MRIKQGFKFRLKTNSVQEQAFRRTAGCARFVWNRALDLQKARLADKNAKMLSLTKLTNLLPGWKSEFSWLKEAPSQVLQQSLRDLDRVFQNFFKRSAKFPRFKKRRGNSSFRYPQGCRLDQEHSRIFLPKVGWVRYFNSRAIPGVVKNVTVSEICGKWYISVQTEREVDIPIHPKIKECVGLDMGISRFCTCSDGTYVLPLNSFKRLEKKLAREQRKLAKKTKFSANWKKQKARTTRLHHRIACCRKDFLHKLSTDLADRYGTICVEDLSVKNMTKSAMGTVENPGRNVRAKSGLNRSILDQGWSTFLDMLSYKLEMRGGSLIRVPAQYTSQTCSVCGYCDPENRKSQAKFACKICGHEETADVNAARNICTLGLEGNLRLWRDRTVSQKQEPVPDPRQLARSLVV